MKIVNMLKILPCPQSHKSVYYHWTTHRPRGLSANDTYMARLCDEKAKQFGEIDASEEGEKTTLVGARNPGG